jgi:hypothetical protein
LWRRRPSRARASSRFAFFFLALLRCHLHLSCAHRIRETHDSSAPPGIGRLATFRAVTALGPAAPVVGDRAIASRIPYAVTIFLGAFLLVPDPAADGKFIIPWYGGSPRRGPDA